MKVLTDWVEEHSNWQESVMIVTADHGHYLFLDRPEMLISGGWRVAFTLRVTATFNYEGELRLSAKRVLAPTDFSETGEHALRYACEFAAAFGAELHLIFVNEPPAAAYSEIGIGYAGVPDLTVQLKEAAEERLKSLRIRRGNRRWPSRDRCCTGRRSSRSCVAREHDIDLIVLGTHGRGAIAHMLLTGSTAEKVVRKAPCPVLTVRPEGHEFVSP